MNLLTEEINKKQGFVYKIDDEYYYMGCHIFKREDDNSSTTIIKYNNYLKLNNEEDAINAKKLYRGIVSRSNGRKSEDANIVQRLDEFINNLDKEQYNSLKNQVESFTKLYREYGSEQ